MAAFAAIEAAREALSLSPLSLSLSHSQTQTPQSAPSARTTSRQRRSDPAPVNEASSPPTSAPVSLDTADVPLFREAEMRRVVAFCEDRLATGRPGSLYLCGCPGTGKTMTVERVQRLAATYWAKKGKNGRSVKVTSINCMSLTDPGHIFSRILDTISTSEGEGGDVDEHVDDDALHSVSTMPAERLAAALTRGSGRTMHLVVVDEVDRLIGSKNQDVLCQLFMLPSAPKSNCILIGISNSMHLVDRFLARLKVLKCCPDIVSFPTYTKDQILSVLEARLKESPAAAGVPLTKLFDRKALELCARKVAAGTGDMRRALDACRNSLCILERELRDSQTEAAQRCCTTVDDRNDGDGDSQQAKRRRSNGDGVRVCDAYDGDESRDYTGPCVGVHHMAKALSVLFASPITDAIRNMPLHQQMILSAFLLHVRSKTRKDPTLSELYQSYCDLLKRQSLHPITVTEFVASCENLSDVTVVRLAGSRKDMKKRKMHTQVDKDDVLFALKDIRLFRAILEGA